MVAWRAMAAACLARSTRNAFASFATFSVALSFFNSACLAAGISLAWFDDATVFHGSYLWAFFPQIELSCSVWICDM
jgi:hypothetical protein